jgi:DNA-binding MarR family transcriptional regulator
MANKTLIVESPDLTTEQKVLGLLLCLAQEKKAEIDRRLRGTLPSFMQLNLLHALSKAPGGRLKVNQLKSALADDSPNVSRALNKLVEMGLARKVRSEQDQRAVYVSITRSGHRAHEEGDVKLMDLSMGLSERELEQLYELLAKL